MRTLSGRMLSGNAAARLLSAAEYVGDKDVCHARSDRGVDQGAAGFTLIEVVCVLAIIALLA